MGDACDVCNGHGRIPARKGDYSEWRTCYKCRGRGAPDPNRPYERVPNRDR